MTSEATTFPAPPISKSLWVSVIGHGLIILMLMAKATFFPSEDIILTNAIRVDLVALPDKMKPPPESLAEPTSQPKIEPKIQPKIEPKIETKKHQKKIFDLAKTQSDQKKALEDLKKQLERDQQAIKEALEAVKEREPKVYKGNVLAPGSEITGLAKIEYDRYLNEIRSRIKSHLILPKWLKDANLRAYVLVKLDERGFVIFKSITQSSGNEMYDNLVLNAVAESSPLPEPPEHLTGILQTDGITLRFPDQFGGGH